MCLCGSEGTEPGAPVILGFFIFPGSPAGGIPAPKTPLPAGSIHRRVSESGNHSSGGGFS